MPPKKINNYSVLYLKLDVESETKLVAVPCNWIKDNYVAYPEIPLTVDDKEMMTSFLKLAIKITTSPPQSWPKYECTILESFATLNGALNRIKKFEEDPKSLQTILKKVSVSSEEIPTKKAKLEESLINILDNSIANLAPPPAITLVSKNITESQELSECPPLPSGVLISSENISEVPVDIVTDHSFEIIDPTSKLFSLNSDLDCTTENTSNNDIKDENQLQRCFLSSSDVQDMNNTLAIISGQLIALSSQNEKLTTTVDNLNQNVNTLISLVKDSNAKSKKEKFAAVDVSTKLQELHTAIMDRRALKENENVVTFHKLQTKYELVLPFLGLEDFKLFDEKLDDALLAADLKQHFLSTISSDINQLKSTMLNIFKVFFSKNLLANVVAQKVKSDKLTFNTTRFYKIWKDSVHNIFSANFDEKLFLTRIGSIIKNSADWDGREGRDKVQKTV